MVTKLTNSSSWHCDEWYWPAVWGHAIGLGYYFIEIFPASFDKMFVLFLQFYMYLIYDT